MLRDQFFVSPQFSTAKSRNLSDLVFGWAGKAGIVFLLVLVSSFHAITLFGSPWAMSQWLVFLLVAAAPAIISTAVVPGAWRKPGRWLLMLGAIFASDPQYTYMVLIVIETWALYRTWVIEAGWRGFGRRVKAIFARLRAGSSKTDA